jgi:hypothetical protein
VDKITATFNNKDKQKEKIEKATANMMNEIMEENLKAKRGVILSTKNNTKKGGDFLDPESKAFSNKMSLTQYASIKGIVEHANINILLNS